MICLEQLGELSPTDRETASRGACANPSPSRRAGYEQAELPEELPGSKLDGLSAQLDHDSAVENDVHAGPGFVPLHENLSGGDIDLGGDRSDPLDRLVGDPGEKWKRSKLGGAAWSCHRRCSYHVAASPRRRCAPLDETVSTPRRPKRDNYRTPEVGNDTRMSLAERLRDPDAYPNDVEDVGFRQTHISLLFFAGDRVYKVKKAVELGFLDFSTLERRRHYCEEEVRLNQALAPGVYLGVVPITEERNGSLQIDGRGPVVEYAVEMRRLPEGQMLDQVLGRGEIDNQRIGALAELLADFHRTAPTGPGVDEYGTPDAVALNVRDNFDQTRDFTSTLGATARSGARTLSPILHTFLSRRAEAFLTSEHGLLSDRVDNGRIRDGHGDLHAGNICLTDEGIVVYDRIEFAERFRCSDVACDLAFLAMDLDLLRFRAFSGFLVRTYAELARDEELERLVLFYKGYRAIVRAKVASIASVARELDANEREAHRLQALRHFHLAASYELPPALVLSCGLPASGKSVAAHAIAESFEARVLRSDVKRKQLAGLPPTRLAPIEYRTGLYSPEMTERTYAALRDEARETLRRGRTAIVDASFSSAHSRRSFADLAAELRSPFVVVELSAPEETIRERLQQRARETGNPSDADLEIYLAMRWEFEPPYEVEAQSLVRIDARLPVEEIVSATIDRLIEQADPGAPSS